MNRLQSLFYTIVVLVLVSSCSQKPEGYAVLLWPAPESAVQAGTILEVFETATVDQIVRARTIDGETDHTVDPWRIVSFETLDAAESYAGEYEAWQDTYARSLRTALPVREQPDRSSTRVYRLRDGELMKILSRENEQSDEAGFVDYWYEVLTREGISGWVFGYYLELTGAGGRSLDPQEEHDGTDRLVRDIAAIDWRPAYFPEMVSSRRVDLTEFAPRFGFFGDWEEQVFELVLPGVERTFEYTDYFSSDGRIIEFEGADLQITVTSEDRISVRYSVNGRQRTTDFVLFEEEISVIIEAERERRRLQLEQFLERGTELVSTAYGQIAFDEDGTIRWSGFERLVPNVLPERFTGTGRFQFGVYLADELRGRYDGAVQLQSNAAAVEFLYSFTDDGVRFVYVPSRLVDGSEIVAEPISPVVIFFRFLR